MTKILVQKDWQCRDRMWLAADTRGFPVVRSITTEIYATLGFHFATFLLKTKHTIVANIKNYGVSVFTV